MTLLRLGVVALLLSLPSSGAGHTAAVCVRLVYLKNGKPARAKRISLVLGDPTYSGRELVASPSPQGVAVFRIPEPAPKTIWVEWSNGLLRGCASMPSISLDRVMKHGVTIGVDKEFGPACGGEKALRKLKGIRPKPGEIIVFVRKLHWWEKMQW